MENEAHHHPFIAGALAGAAEICCTYPLEYSKTQVQLGVYQNSRECFRYAWHNGVKVLYRGLQSNLAFAFPRTAIRFGVYEGILNRWRLRDPKLTSGQLFIAGAVAGFVEGAVIVVPMTTLQVRLIADQNRPGGQLYTGIMQLTRHILKSEGPKGVYRGAVPTVLKIVFNISFRFVLYDMIVDALNAASKAAATRPEWHNDVTSFVAGGMAGALTVLANQPIDVIKSHIQAGTHTGGILSYGRWILATGGGYRALYRGLVPRLNRVVAETGLTMVFYRRFSSLCNTVLDDDDAV